MTTAPTDSVVTLFALVADPRSAAGRRSLAIRRIPMQQGLQRTVTAMFAEQAAALLDPALERIPFDPGYQPEDDEVFRIPDFPLPHGLGEALDDVQGIEPLFLPRSEPPQIRAIVAVARESHPTRISVYFQQFTPTRLIQPRRMMLLLRRGTFGMVEDPGITLDTKVAAVYAEGSLLFRIFKNVNGFLDLAGYFQEMSEQGIVETLDHHALVAEDAERVAREASQWMRKRFAMLSASGILDRIKPAKIQRVAAKYGVTVATRVVDGKRRIVFPADRQGARKLLQFLNEERYLGCLTKTLYETNSKREAS